MAKELCSICNLGLVAGGTWGERLCVHCTNQERIKMQEQKDEEMELIEQFWKDEAEHRATD